MTSCSWPSALVTRPSCTKTILGWIVDTHIITLGLPECRITWLSQLLSNTLAKTYATRKGWQQLLGELHSMVPALQSAKYLFSILHHHLANRRQRRCRLTVLPCQALADWVTLLHQLRSRPVPNTHLVPQAPHILAATDASKDDMGGFEVHTTIAPGATPYAWCCA